MSRDITVTPTGELDLATAHELRRALAEAVAGRALTVVDFAAVTFIDSTILGVLVSAANRCRDAGSRLVVIRASGIVLKAMTLTGLNDTFGLAGPPPELEQEWQELVSDPQFAS